MVKYIKENNSKQWIDMDDLEDYIFILEKNIDTIYNKVSDKYADNLYNDTQTLIDILKMSITKLESSESSADIVNDMLLKRQRDIDWFVNGLKQNPRRLINTYYDSYADSLIDYLGLHKLQTYLLGNTDVRYIHKI